jgi:GNAT superfamily N-acetyltransferase
VSREQPSDRAACREICADHPDANGLIEDYFAELRHRLGHFDPPPAEELRADAKRGVTVVRYEGRRSVGCGSIRRLDAETAEVKRMFVIAEARGRGHGRAILRALEEKARALGCTRIVLDTASELVEAAALYESCGYREVPRYNDNPFAGRWFEKIVIDR